MQDVLQTLFVSVTVRCESSPDVTLLEYVLSVGWNMLKKLFLSNSAVVELD